MLSVIGIPSRHNRANEGNFLRGSNQEISSTFPLQLEKSFFFFIYSQRKKNYEKIPREVTEEYSEITKNRFFSIAKCGKSRVGD
jgi:hypothetical protein